MQFEITEQVLIQGLGGLSVVVKQGRIYAEDGNNGPKILFTQSELKGLGIEFHAESVCVGKLNGVEISLVSLDEHEPHRVSDDSLCGLRQLLPALDENETQAAARAMQLQSWLSLHRFCGRCGTPTELAFADRALVCPRCNNRMYPKLAPCVIGVVVRGDEVLLANGVRYPEKIYTALAGFIEVGESAEQAFAREVMEEVGIAIKNIEYIGSQNWPFPHQLMLAFIADYESGEIKIDEKEIVDAQWFNKSELPSIPGNYTIARKVIEEAVRRI